VKTMFYPRGTYLDLNYSENSIGIEFMSARMD
jgi:hypothetical protein